MTGLWHPANLHEWRESESAGQRGNVRKWVIRASADLTADR
jgi:hypothetical protein